MPKTVFLANMFHGRADLLQQAIDSGEVQVKADDGKEFLSFKSITTSHVKATESVNTITGAKQLNDEEAMQLKAAMLQEAKLDFIMVEKEADLKMSADKKGIPEKIEQALNEARDGMKRELKAAQKLIDAAMQHEETKSYAADLKTNVKLINKVGIEVDEVLMCRECNGEPCTEVSLNNTLFQAARATQKLMVSKETAKKAMKLLIGTDVF